MTALSCTHSILYYGNVAHFRQQCHNSKFVIFQEKLSKVLKCYNFLWVQLRHNCSPVASFANCVMTLYLLKVHLQTFLSIPISQKCQILSWCTLVANERYDILITQTSSGMQLGHKIRPGHCTMQHWRFSSDWSCMCVSWSLSYGTLFQSDLLPAPSQLLLDSHICITLLSALGRDWGTYGTCVSGVQAVKVGQ
jgi:hypothetical protein